MENSGHHSGNKKLWLRLSWSTSIAQVPRTHIIVMCKRSIHFFLSDAVGESTGSIQPFSVLRKNPLLAAASVQRHRFKLLPHGEHFVHRTAVRRYFVIFFHGTRTQHRLCSTFIHISIISFFEGSSLLAVPKKMFSECGTMKSYCCVLGSTT